MKKVGDIVKVIDSDMEHAGYYGEIVDIDGDEIAVDFTYNMVKLKNGGFGAFFSKKDLRKQRD